MRQLKFFVLLCLIGGFLPVYAQQCADCAQTSTHGDKFSYSFSNFAWWHDDELRAYLKSRIPTLGDQLTRGSEEEESIRTELTKLLLEKGIRAHVQSLEPSADVWSQKRIPEAPPPSIVFSIISPPEITVDKLALANAPPDSDEHLKETALQLQGRPYSATGFWSIEMQIKNDLAESGYLSATVFLRSGSPRKEGERYLVEVDAEITPGPRYHVSRIKADGGPLLNGRDLSPYFSLKPGDVAAPNPFGRLAGSVRAYYWHLGYPDVEFNGDPVLDHERALASYEFKVIPGYQYHLRSVKVEGLSTEQQEQALALLGLKKGDVYDTLALTMLSKKLGNSSLSGYEFSYTPKKDKEKHVVDLTLHFYKK